MLGGCVTVEEKEDKDVNEDPWGLGGQMLRD